MNNIILQQDIVSCRVNMFNGKDDGKFNVDTKATPKKSQCYDFTKSSLKSPRFNVIERPQIKMEH